MWPIIIKILTFLGTAALKALITRVLMMAFKAFIGKIKEKLAQRIGGRVVAWSVKDFLIQLNKNKNPINRMKIDDLEALLDEDGAIIAEQDVNGSIDKASIEIVSSHSVDNRISEMMKQNEGILIFEAA